MKAILISTPPEACEAIASGKKTIEVRKTRPKIEMPVKCYIYMTKSGNGVIHQTKNGGIKISCGCFLGTMEDFSEAVKCKHGDSKFGKEYNLVIELIKVHFGIENIEERKANEA